MSLKPNLALQLIDDALPWNHARQFRFDSFLESYTLHDSCWETLNVNCGWQATVVAVVRFDPVWNKAVAQTDLNPGDWPLLFLRFTSVSSVVMDGYADIGGLQRGIGETLVTSVTESEMTTKIIDHYGASVFLRHHPLVDALVITDEEKIILLP